MGIGRGHGIFSSKLGTGSMSPADSALLQPFSPNPDERMIRKRYSNETNFRARSNSLMRRPSENPASTCYSAGGSTCSGPSSLASSTHHLFQMSENLKKKTEAMRDRRVQLTAAG
jgi:hypothetical protein